MTFTPLFDRVLVRPLAEEQGTGFFMPESGSKPNKGEVVGIGKGKYNIAGEFGSPKFEEPTVKVGDKIIFGKFAALEEIDMDGKKLFVMRESDILGITD